MQIKSNETVGKTSAERLYSGASQKEYIGEAKEKHISFAEPAGVGNNYPALQRHLATLDSIVIKQEQTISQLKMLNATAVSTMLRIRRHFILSERLMRANLKPIDSVVTSR
jgi:hypothetical protein